MLLHLESLKRDLPGEMRRIASFLDISVDESRWDAIVEYCSFDWMKRNAARCVPMRGAFWDAGAQVFINKGINGRWTDVLSPQEVAQYESRSVQELGADCAHWLATGARPG